MSNEFNKIFAALLCAVLTIWLVGFAADRIVHPKELEKDAVAIEGEADEHGGGEAAAGPTVPEPFMALIATADVEKGAKISKACAACHSFEKGGATKQGPSLWAIVGHAKGAHEGFDYSDGLKAKGGNWDYDALNHFLWKPKKFVEGTKMNFIGLKKPEERAAIVAWLRMQADSPVALPTEAEISAEAAALAPPPADAAVPSEGVAAPAEVVAPVEGAAPAANTTEEKAAVESAPVSTQPAATTETNPVAKGTEGSTKPVEAPKH